MVAEAVDLAVVRDAELHRYFHAGQRQAHESTARFVLVLAGTQSGKTSYGPHWLLAEMQRKGPGDYLVATPTFPLLEVKLLPEFRKLFETQLGLGEYRFSPPPRRFTLSDAGEVALWGARQTIKTQIFFGYAADPDSLESATIKAAWLDEAGQKQFKLGSWEAILRRLSINQGRALITTTPYSLGWLKSELYDRASDPLADVEVVNFASTANPRFPRAEFERARRELPGWKFSMFYKGLFERPAGMIYGCFDDDNLIDEFAIPDTWARFLGVDFGGVNTASIYLAEEQNDDGAKTGRYIAYREYHASSPYEIRLHGHKVVLRHVPPGEKVIFFLRDPVNRFVSGFYSRQRRGQPRLFSEWSPGERHAFLHFATANQLALALSSDDAHERYDAQEAMRAIGHVRSPYADWFGDQNYFLSRLRDVFFIGFQETLAQDFERLRTKLGVDPRARLPDDEVNSHRNPPTVDRHLDQQARVNLRAWYAEDYRFLKLCQELADDVNAVGSW